MELVEDKKLIANAVTYLNNIHPEDHQHRNIVFALMAIAEILLAIYHKLEGENGDNRSEQS